MSANALTGGLKWDMLHEVFALNYKAFNYYTHSQQYQNIE